MARIFLCHASEDKAQVREVCHRLKALGFEPWLDEEDLFPGQIWADEIPRALKASEFILVFFSSNSVAKRGYVQREMKMALDAWEEIPGNMIHTIPVRLDECELPEPFGRYHRADLFDPRGFDRLVGGLNFGLEQRGKPTLTPLESPTIDTEPPSENPPPPAAHPSQESEPPPAAPAVPRSSHIRRSPSFSTETREAQDMLKQLGFDPGPIDGIWGYQTESALRQYQRSKELPETGLPDDFTMGLLESDATKPSQVNPTSNLPKTITNTIGMEFVLIPAGTFTMGSPDSDQDANDNEKPAHQVTISQPFYLGKYEVTEAQWKAVMDENPSKFKGANHPVERVSWNDTQQFIQKLNEREGSRFYRLPTEAEWEYACRADTATIYSFGDDPAQLDDYAWYNANSGGKTHPVGKKKPNPWGLYDMHGNVWEWVQDLYVDDYYQYSPTSDPQGPTRGESRVLRGGSWIGHGQYARSAYRDRNVPGGRDVINGFRLARGQKSQ